MRLKDWIDDDGRKLDDLAPLVGTNTSNLSKIVRGLVWVGGDIAENIRTLTDGKVTPSDLLDAWKDAEAERIARKRPVISKTGGAAA